MSGLEINKIVGTILVVALITTVVGLVGNALVPVPDQKSAVFAAADEPASPKSTTPKPAANKRKPLAPLLAAAKISDGKTVSRKCGACHSMKQGGKNKIGPGLWNIVSAPKARSNFSYSKALKAKGGTWTFAHLDAFLEKPKGFIKGTKMLFAGIKKATDRAALLVYLRSLSKSPVPLP